MLYAFNQYNEFQRPILAVFENMRGSERVNEQSEKVENSKKVPRSIKKIMFRLGKKSLKLVFKFSPGPVNTLTANYEYTRIFDVTTLDAILKHFLSEFRIETNFFRISTKFWVKYGSTPRVVCTNWMLRIQSVQAISASDFGRFWKHAWLDERVNEQSEKVENSKKVP